MERLLLNYSVVYGEKQHARSNLRVSTQRKKQRFLCLGEMAVSSSLNFSKLGLLTRFSLQDCGVG